jgi:CP family cyanate transporter-like MFS transporter
VDRSGSSPTAATPAPVTARAGAVLAIVAITLVAFSSRGSFTAVGPLLDPLERELGVSPSGGAALVALPLVCFGLLALVVPRLSARVGLHRTMSLGIGILACGVLVRAAGVPGLFLGTVLVGSGIALLNVLLPAITKADFPHRWALLTALVTTSMTLSASLGAGLGQPLHAVTGSAQGSLLLWLIPIALAGLFWAPVARSRNSPAGLNVPTAIAPILRDRIGLAVALFFGLQTLTFYTLLTWLPSILVELGGETPQRAGALVAIGTALGVPVALALPPIVGRRPSQVPWVLGLTVLTGVAVLGLAVAPAWMPELWTMLWGLANGASFPVAMSLVQLRTRNGPQAGQLAAAAQFAGYLLAAVGPLSVGLLIDATGSWLPCFLLLGGVVCAQLVAGIVAGRPRLIGAP